MDHPKIIFIGLQELNIETKTPQLNKELSLYKSWLKGVKPSNPIIISSCLGACITFSEALFNTFNYPLAFLKSLIEHPQADHIPDQSQNFLPETLFPNKIDPLLHYAYTNHDLCIIVLEESLFLSFNLKNHSRSNKLSSYHDIILQDEKQIKINSNTLTEYQEKIMNYANDKTICRYESTTEAFKLLSNKLRTVPEEVKTVCKSMNSEFSKNQRQFLQIVQKNNELTLEMLRKIEELQRTANFYKEAADLYVMSSGCSENARVRIRSLKVVNGEFVLKIVNESNEDLKRVQVIVCENQECKGKFIILQRFCTVYLKLKLNEEDFYKHLVVVSGDSVISDVFVMFPLRIEKDKLFKKNSLIKLSNLTDRQVPDIRLASTDSIENIIYLQRGLNARESTYITVPKKEPQEVNQDEPNEALTEGIQSTLLLISDSQQASNLLTISL